jgi:hypothetical protein
LIEIQAARGCPKIGRCALHATPTLYGAAKP